MIRVLWVLKGLGPGGAERLLVEAARTHDLERFSIDCAYVLPWKDHLANDLEERGVHTICLSRRRRDPRWPLRLRKLIQSGDYNIVHVHSPLPGAMARLSARSMSTSRRPAVMSTEHNTWGTHHQLTRWANRLTSRWDASTLAVTDEVKRSMRGRGAKQAEVLTHGIAVTRVAALQAERDAVRAEFGIEPSTIAIGTVANFREQKDYPNLLAAAATLVGRRLPVRFVTVGQGQLERQIREERDRLRLADEVTLTGFRPDAARVMAGCDVFTMASKWEGLPVALMEAFALGLPVVATAVGGLAEALHDEVDALLVPPGDPDALADALARVVEDAELRARLAAASQARAAEFDTTRATARIEEIYTTIAPDRPAAANTEPIASPKRRRSSPAGIEIRRATAEDRAAILELCRSSLGWGDNPRFEELYSWKHDENAFGASPTWVATEGAQIIGLRAFMRWEFERGGQLLRAVRAVDTATHPSHQGKGLFTALTQQGLAELEAEDIDFVFNTPNDKSRPGYLKMGWQVVGQLPAAVRPRGLASVYTITRSRAAAAHWPSPLEIGEPFAGWLERRGEIPGTADDTDVRALRTALRPEVLAWRYGTPLLGYRAIEADDGVVVVRARQRGAGRELVVLASLGLEPHEEDRVVAQALRQSGCSHALRLGSPNLRAGFVPIPGGGPVLTWRALGMSAMPPLSNWQLGMGEVELF